MAELPPAPPTASRAEGSLHRWKARLRAAAPGPARAYLRLKELAWRAQHRGAYLHDLFSSIHRDNLWGEAESVSGPGSSFAETAAVRRELPGLLGALGVKSLLDAPCGDCHWIAQTELQLVRYVGVDIVPELIARNRAQFAAREWQFHTLDITRDPLPSCDAILCRDCLIHLSFHYIRRALQGFRRSNARYLLTTSYRGLRRNHDILSGQWRPIDLQLPPFSFPEPIARIVEKEYTEDGAAIQRSLVVWPLGEQGSAGGG